MRAKRNNRKVIITNGTSSARGEQPIEYPEWFWKQGLRVAYLLVLAGKGKTAYVAKKIFREHKHVICTSWTVNSRASLIARIYYKDTKMLDETIDSIRSMNNIMSVEFFEIVKVVDRKTTKQIRQDIKMLIGKSD